MYAIRSYYAQPITLAEIVQIACETDQSAGDAVDAEDDQKGFRFRLVRHHDRVGKDVASGDQFRQCLETSYNFV